MIPRFFAEPTMKLLRQSNADHATPGMLHQGKASDNGSGHEAENQSDEGGNCGAHGDTPPIRNSTIMVMATEPQTILRLGLSHGLRLGPNRFASLLCHGAISDQGHLTAAGWPRQVHHWVARRTEKWAGPSLIPPKVRASVPSSEV